MKFELRVARGILTHAKPPVRFRHVLGHSQCRQDTFIGALQEYFSTNGLNTQAVGVA
jgi:hypothetical protein